MTDMQIAIASKAQELAAMYRNQPSGIMACLDALGCKEEAVDEAIGAIADANTDEQASQFIDAALMTLQ